jgi:hypothetical protein
MRTSMEIRTAGWAGIFFLLLCLLPLPLTGSLVKPFPYASDSDQQLIEWFADNRLRAFVQGTASQLSLCLLVVFAVGLAKHLTGPGRGDLFQKVLMLSAAVVATSYGATNWLWSVPAFAGTPGHPPADGTVIRLGFDITVMAYFVSQPFTALFLVAAGIAVRQSRALPGWVAWWAFAGSVSALATVLEPWVTGGWLVPWSWWSLVPYILLFVWVPTVGVMLVRNPGTDPPHSISEPVAATDRARD